MAKTKNKISENISFKEATFSKTAKSLKIKNQPSETHIKNMQIIASKVFQPLREWCDHPIRVNSMYRSPDLCVAVGSTKTSQHTKGQALDISSLGEKTNGELFEWIKENLDFDQMIWEFGTDMQPNWIHVSYVSEEKNRNKCLKAYKEHGKTKYKVISS